MSTLQPRSGTLQSFSMSTRTLCSNCAVSISGAERVPQFHCQECTSFVLCIDCFATGKELAGHTNAHKYTVSSNEGFPLYERGWHASHEGRLVEGLEKFGFANWRRVGEYVGKAPSECSRHFFAVYDVDSNAFPLPATEIVHRRERGDATAPIVEAPKAAASAEGGTATEDSTANGTATSSSAAAAAATAPPSETTATTAASGAPSAGAVAEGPPSGATCAGPDRSVMKGHWPKRDDFDVEWADDSEMLIAGMQFDGRSEPLNPSAVSRATEEAEAFFARALSAGQPIAALEADVAAAVAEDEAAAALSSSCAAASGEAEENAAAEAVEKQRESTEAISGRLVIKLEVLQLYNQRLDGRVARKNFVKKHDILDYQAQVRFPSLRAALRRVGAVAVPPRLCSRARVSLTPLSPARAVCSTARSSPCPKRSVRCLSRFARSRTSKRRSSAFFSFLRHAARRRRRTPSPATFLQALTLRLPLPPASRRHRELSDSLIMEVRLRKQIETLQEYRRLGISSAVEASQYEQRKREREDGAGDGSAAGRRRCRVDGSSSSSSSSSSGGGGAVAAAAAAAADGEASAPKRRKVGVAS